MAGTAVLNSNLAALNAERRLAANSKALDVCLTRLSSGLRINRAVDDAAGLSISETLNVDARIYAQGLRNINDSVSLADIQESALRELANVTMRQQELAEQAANGVYSAPQREAMDQEARALTNEYNRIIQTTEFNGIKLFTSPYETLTAQFGTGIANSLGFAFADQLMTKVTPGSYFRLSGVEKDYYVWFTVDGAGTDPKLQDATGIRADLRTSETGGTETTRIICPTGEGAGAGYFNIYSRDAEYYVWFNVDGSSSDPAPGGTGFEVAVDSGIEKTSITLPEADDIVDAISQDGHAYFTFSSPIMDYYCWFTVDGMGGDPMLPGTGIQVALSAGADGDDAAMETAFQITNTTFVGEPHEPVYTTWSSGGVLNLENSSGGNVTDATAGNIAAAVNVWNQGGTPTSSDTVKQAIIDALNSTGDFSAISTGPGILTATTLEIGMVYDATNHGSGTSLQVLTQGTGGAYNFSTSLVAQTVAIALSDTGVFATSVDEYNHVLVTSTVKGQTTDAREVNSGTVLIDTIVEGEGRKTFTMGNASSNAYFVDLNNDNLPDMITTDTVSSTLSIRLATSDGTFEGRTSYAVGSGVSSALFADLNNDGVMDIVTSNTASSSVCLGNGDGSFRAQNNYSGTAANYLSDVNGDGAKDMLLSTWGTVAVRLNNGNGTFRASNLYTTPTVALFADINGDSKEDIICPDSGNDRIHVRLNNGDGTYRAPTYYTTGDYPNNLLFGDVNDDGRTDVLSIDASGGTFSVLVNNGNGTFKARRAYTCDTWPKTVYYEDINRDGIEDYVSVKGTIAVALGNSNGSFKKHVTYRGGPSVDSAYFEDLNGDGCKDIVSVYATMDQVYVNLANANGSFSAVQQYATGDNPVRLYLQDLNYDGRADIITADRDSDTISVRLNNGNGTFQARTSYAMGDGPCYAYFVDADHDDRVDILTLGSTSSLNLRSNDGRGGFSPKGETQEVTLLSFQDPYGMCLVNHLDLSHRSTALEAMNVLDDRLNRINAQLGSIGSLQSRLQVVQGTVSIARENYISAASQITNADVADEAAELVRRQILEQVSTAILHRASLTPELALTLLHGL